MVYTIRRRIPFSLYETPASYNGTAKYSISIYEAFLRLYGDKYDVHLLINRAADNFHKLSERHDNVWYPDTINDQTFHIAFSSIRRYTHIEHMFILNRTCLKYVFCMQDIIEYKKLVPIGSGHSSELMSGISRCAQDPEPIGTSFFILIMLLHASHS